MTEMQTDERGDEFRIPALDAEKDTTEALDAAYETWREAQAVAEVRGIMEGLRQDTLPDERQKALAIPEMSAQLRSQLNDLEIAIMAWGRHEDARPTYMKQIAEKVPVFIHALRGVRGKTGFEQLGKAEIKYTAALERGELSLADPREHTAEEFGAAQADKQSPAELAQEVDQQEQEAGSLKFWQGQGEVFKGVTKCVKDIEGDVSTLQNVAARLDRLSPDLDNKYVEEQTVYALRGLLFGNGGQLDGVLTNLGPKGVGLAADIEKLVLAKPSERKTTSAPEESLATQ